MLWNVRLPTQEVYPTLNLQLLVHLDALRHILFTKSFLSSSSMMVAVPSWSKTFPLRSLSKMWWLSLTISSLCATTSSTCLAQTMGEDISGMLSWTSFLPSTSMHSISASKGLLGLLIGHMLSATSAMHAFRGMMPLLRTTIIGEANGTRKDRPFTTEISSTWTTWSWPSRCIMVDSQYRHMLR